MARSTLMRVSTPSAEVIKERADRNGRTQVAELDRVIAAGVEAIDRAESRRAKTAKTA